MTRFDEDGNPIEPSNGFPVPQCGRFKLILVTHDESTFYANDRRTTKWVHESEKPTLMPKGDGQSLMVSDFLSSEWGCLSDEDYSYVPNTAFFLISNLISTVKHSSSFTLANIMMDILIVKCSVNKLRKPSTFLNQRQMGMPRVCSSLTMHLAIKFTTHPESEPEGGNDSRTSRHMVPDVCLRMTKISPRPLMALSIAR